MQDLIKFDDDEHNNVLTILDKIDSDALFVIHHYISEFSKSFDNVIVVCLNHHPQHFTAIQKRLGNIDLKATFINGFDLVTREDGSLCTLASSSLASLRTLIIDAIKANRNCKPAVIIDDLTILLSMGHSVKDVIRFIYGIQRVTDEYDGKFIRLLYADIYHESQDVRLLIDYSLSTSHYVIQTSGLQSGNSVEIDGHISVALGSRFIPRKGNKVFSGKELHYKVLESGVKFTGKGLSSAVI